MEFKDIVMERYATKKFDGRKIDDKKFDELLDMIRHAPSSLNIQPWRIKIVTDQAVKERLRALAWGQEQITTCSHLLVLCADTDLTALVDRLEADMKKAGVPDENIKSYAGMTRGFVSGMDAGKTLAWAQRQVYLALGNALNGAKSLGFDSCPMEGFDPSGFAKELGLPKNLVPTVLCPIGYAADKPRPKSRFPKGDVFF
ncbi:MAG: NAD(P)H-dependent oxidoreductase [Candidatus Micrarchaeia archaeon]